MCGSRQRINRAVILCISALFLLRVSADPALLEAARWVPDADSPPAESHPAGLRFPCPFPVESSLERHVWDLTHALDFSEADGFWLDWTLEAAEAFRGITLYLETSGGWHAMAPELRDLRHRQWIPFARFEPPPAREALRKVRTLRISPWNARRELAGAVQLHALTPARARVAFVVPEKGVTGGGDLGYVLRILGWMERQFNALNVATARFPDTALADLSPAQYAVLVLPHLPEPDAEMLRVLREQLRAGARLMVFYNGHPGLAAICGVRALAFRPASEPGQWHALHMENPPLTVVQSATPHLIPAEAANAQGRVFARWLSRSGDARAEAGVLLTPQAAWFSALPQPEDERAQRRLLGRVLQALAPADLSVELPDPDVEAALDRLAMEAAPPLPVPRLGVWAPRPESFPGGDPLGFDSLKRAGVTDLYVFVPRGNQPDPELLRLAAGRRLRVHLWHIAWKGAPPPAEHADAARWQRAPDGSLIGWRCPSHPANREEELQLLRALAATPGIAGIHIDYMRFPNGPLCHCAACKTRIEEEGEAATRIWRMNLLTEFVGEIGRALREHSPELERSAAVWPAREAVKDSLGQDWTRWLEDESLDVLIPMSYTTRAGELQAWTRDHVAADTRGGRILAGIGISSDESRLQTEAGLRQIRAALEAGAAGVVLYALDATLTHELLPVLERWLEKTTPLPAEPASPGQSILLTPGGERRGLSAVRGQELHFHVEVPEAITRLVVSISGGSGDADLYLRREEAPTRTGYDFRPWVRGNEEQIEVFLPEAGTWRLMLRGDAGFEEVTLSVRTHAPPAELGPESGLLRGDVELALYYELSGLKIPEEAWNVELRNQLLRREGRMAFNDGNFQESLAIWKRWSEIDPGNEEPLSLIGDIYLRLDEIDTAIQFYERSLEIRPGQVGLMVRLARLLDVAAKRPEQARELLNRYSRLLPDHAEIPLAQAEWLIRRRRYPEAEDLIRTVLSVDPKNLGAYTMLHGLLNLPEERIQNFRQILAVGQQPGLEAVFARAIGEYQLLLRPESWVLMPFMKRMSLEAPGELVREQFHRFLPRETEAREDFRIGRISRNWVSSMDEAWNDDGRLILSADLAQTEAFLRLVGSDSLHSGFVEANVEDTQGFFWLYARRGEGSMVRYGYDEDGRIYLQIWLNGHLITSMNRVWPREGGRAILRLELRGDGAFAFLDGRAVFDHPLSIPKDMGLGWWGIAPWSPIPGRARVAIREVAGGPLHTHLYLPAMRRPGFRTSDETTRLKERLKSAGAVLPDWYHQDFLGGVVSHRSRGDEELRLLTRYYRTRIYPIVQVREAAALSVPVLVELVRREQYDGLTLLLPKFPDPGLVERFETAAIRHQIAINLLHFDENIQTAVFQELTPHVGLFAGKRDTRNLPLRDLAPEEKLEGSEPHFFRDSSWNARFER